METHEVSTPDILRTEALRLQIVIDNYNQIIAQTAIAWEKIQSQTGSLDFQFKASPYDENPMSLFVYWHHVDREALSVIVGRYANTLLGRRMQMENELEAITRQLKALGQWPEIER